MYNISVPFTNKEISFEFETFRDKLKPGEEEEWKIILKGDKGEALFADLLVSMYDGSLDAFRKQTWNFNLYSQSSGNSIWNTSIGFNIRYGTNIKQEWKPQFHIKKHDYDRLNWFGFNYYGGYLVQDGGRNLHETGMILPADKTELIPFNIDDKKLNEISQKKEQEAHAIQIRRDFRETAFFFPSLETNENGEAIIAFKMPESLTRWKLLGLAHTKDLKCGQFLKEVLTQKELMVVPNPPRFFRENDQMQFTAGVINITDKEISGNVEIDFYDTRTMEQINEKLGIESKSHSFSVTKEATTVVEWDIKIPEGFDYITYRIKAKSSTFSDGEEKTIPVLKNRMLVTESLPMPVKGKETKEFVFDKLVNQSSQSSTLTNHKLVLEFASNPIWYAIQALPYLMESESESADQMFNRYYANVIAQHILNSDPRIKQVFDTWRNFSPDALISQLEKNHELKSVALEETPWVMDAQNETERKQRIALLFDINKLTQDLSLLLKKLQNKQSPNGGWPWFNGMRENRKITQNIISGFGRLQKLGILDLGYVSELTLMIKKALDFLDREMYDDYIKLKEKKDINLEKNHLSELNIQYLYTRSFFNEVNEVPEEYFEAYEYYLNQAENYFTSYNKFLQGMIALALYRDGNKESAIKILMSLKETALYDKEMGMYWRADAGFYWYEAPIETQSMLIEAFNEISVNPEAVEQMQIWLLKQKQTQSWETGRATADAVYSLLMNGDKWLAQNELAEISIGGSVLDPLNLESNKVEAGTGYFKKSWAGGEINPDMGKVTVTSKSDNISWGALYWQYFEDLDKITSSGSPLSLHQGLYLKKLTSSGPVLEPIEEETIKTGDEIIVRIEIRTDRHLEFVHLKDMRASAFEPVNVISGYQFREGLGYYQTITDASIHFYFDRLTKGTWIFEYPLVVSQKGEFSNGITSVRCMYAPEFGSNSEGVRIKVK